MPKRPLKCRPRRKGGDLYETGTEFSDEPFECLTLAVVSDPGMRITAAQSAQPGSIREPGELCELLQDRSH